MFGQHKPNQLLLSLKPNKKTINLQYTKYPVIREVAQAMDFQLSNQTYHLLWTDAPLSAKDIREEHQLTRVNHIPQVTQLTRKNRLACNLNSMRIFFPRHYNFYPETWVLPSDLHKIVKKHTRGKVYIVKPEGGCQGQGIYLTDNPNKLQRSSHEVVQEYLMRPLLIDGLKFDMRWYVLVTCVQPLRIYLFNDGIVRFATENFEVPNPDNMNDHFKHLTNYAINKKSQKFETESEHSHKRLISSVFRNDEYNQLFSGVSQIVNKTIIAGLPAMQNAYSQCKKTDPSSCFQLLGFDIIMNERREPLLLEVNQNPSLVTDTTIDKELKSKLVRNVLEMVTGNYHQRYPQDKPQTKVKLKDRHQGLLRDNFMRIYPADTLEQTQQYDLFLSKAHSLFRDKFGIGVVRSVRKHTTRLQESLNWNEQPSFYSRERVERVYSRLGVKTSAVRKRMVML